MGTCYLKPCLTTTNLNANLDKKIHFDTQNNNDKDKNNIINEKQMKNIATGSYTSR